MHRFYIGKRSALLSVGNIKSFQGENFQPPPPQKSNGLPLSFMFICHGPNHVFFTHEILDFRLIIIIIIIMMMMM